MRDNNSMFYAWFKWQSIVNLIIDSDKPLYNIGETHASAVSRAIECGIPQRLGVVGIISALVDLRGESMIKDSKDDRL